MKTYCPNCKLTMDEHEAKYFHGEGICSQIIDDCKCIGCGEIFKENQHHSCDIEIRIMNLEYQFGIAHK